MTRTSNQLMGYARVRTRRTQELYDLDVKVEPQTPAADTSKTAAPQGMSANRA